MAQCITDLISYDVFSIVLSYLDILDEHKLLWLISNPDTRLLALLGWRRNTKYVKQLGDFESCMYLVNGKLHRLESEGPAVVCQDFDAALTGDFDAEYYSNGALHRLNGPARIWFNRGWKAEFWKAGVKQNYTSVAAMLIEHDGRQITAEIF